MSRQDLSLVARGAAILVTLVGLYASAQIAGTVGDIGGNAIVSFLVSFLFFGSLAILLWLAAETIDAVDRLHQQADSTQRELRSLRSQRLDPMNAALVGLGSEIGRLRSEGSAGEADTLVPVDAEVGSDASLDKKTPLGEGAGETPPTITIVEECAVEQAGSVNRPRLRAVKSSPGGGWILVDDQPIGAGPGTSADYDLARAEALRGLTDRLVGNGWEPLPISGPNALPRFRRTMTKAGHPGA